MQGTVWKIAVCRPDDAPGPKYSFPAAGGPPAGGSQLSPFPKGHLAGGGCSQGQPTLVTRHIPDFGLPLGMAPGGPLSPTAPSGLAEVFVQTTPPLNFSPGQF